MNVVCLTGISRNAGGLFYAVSSLCKSLRASGTEVSVMGRSDSFSEEDRSTWSPVPVTAYKGFGPLGSSVELRRFLFNHGADVVHQHGIWMDDQWAALQWQNKTGNPVVISPHGMLDPWAVQNSAWKKKLAGALFANPSLHKATCLHALCRSEAESIRAYGLKNPIAIIPNGIELPALIPNDGLPVSGEKRKLLFLGRIHPKKGLKELLQAWDGFSKNWKLIIAGWDDGGYEMGLKAQVAVLGLGNSVEFVGAKFGAEKERLLRSVDAFILPSFSEGLPMSVLEAWSFQLPVVMTDFCNLPEGFAAGAAIRVEPAAESIFQGLEKLAALSGNELQGMGAKGRTLVEEEFTWPRIAENMRKVYDWCLTGINPPTCMEFIDG